MNTRSQTYIVSVALVQKKWTAFILAFLAASTVLFAQPGNIQCKQHYKEALRLYNLADATPESDSLALTFFVTCANTFMSDHDYVKAADCLIKAGVIHQIYQRFAASNECYRQSLAINKAYAKNDKIKYEASLNLGSSFYFSHDIDSARHYFEQASTIALLYKGPALPEQDRLYNSLGAIYFESANYIQARNYFDMAFRFSPADSPDYEYSLVSIHSNIANCLTQLNQYDSALKVYAMLKTYPMDSDDAEIIRQNIAHTLFEMGRYDTALAIYNQLSAPAMTELNKIKALNDIARIYLHQGQWQRAEYLFDSAMSFNRKRVPVFKNRNEALSYLYRGQLAARQGLLSEAITWCNEAMRRVHLSFQWKAPTDLPADVSQTISPIVLFEILSNKATFLYAKYKLTRQKIFLIGALMTCRKAIQTANFIKLNFDNDEAKFFFNKNYQAIYSQAIAIAWESCQVHQKYIDDYIYIIENYKGSILYQNLENIQLKSNATVPEQVKKRENEIKYLLGFYTSHINNNPEEDATPLLQKKLIELQVELSRLQKQYELDEVYNLYQYQLPQQDQSLAFIQSTIDSETALVSYYATDSAVYLLAINKKDARLVKINIDTGFRRNLNEFFQGIYQHQEGKRYTGFSASAYLYKTLLSPAEDILDECSKWIIVPDGLLYYLPFEALTKNEKERSYLVETKTINYHYSFALLLQKNTHHYSEEGDEVAIAFAPFTIRDDKVKASGWQYLPFSYQEVVPFISNISFSTEATKQNFIQKAPHHTLIHLATHASIGPDGTSGWIQFYPADSNTINNRLFVHEIYNLNLHSTELVILSACQTAGGTTSSGEGLLSLSRAFLYAGSDGIISTLWKTDDRVAAYIMQQLHKYLNTGATPEKALRLAKIDLLNNKEFGAQYKNPNYWANFIYIGKASMPEPEKGIYVWAIIVFLISAGALVTFIFFSRVSTTGNGKFGLIPQQRKPIAHTP